ncbi:MAG: quinol dehydrogenase ferredoxin subunit NapH [Spirochaetota bacterium]|nr:quinol dehydrogenase ferredoxin subunit NapH [Spirochaetota bacterium]
MSSILLKHRYSIARRMTQISIIIFYILANTYGLKLLEGNLSSSILLDTVPLSDPFAVLQIFAAGVIVSANALIGAAIIFFLYAIFLGRAFCGWVCPMNIVTDTANWIRHKLKIDIQYIIITRNTRYWILGLTLILSVILGVGAFEYISPISILHRGLIFGMGLGWTIVSAVFIFDLLILKEGFCGHICPLGAFNSLISRFSLIRVNHNANKCTQCMECVAICPEKQVLSVVTDKINSPILSGECTNCARCVEVCEDNAMKWGLRFKYRSIQTKEV